jgi:hypothetical protein
VIGISTNLVVYDAEMPAGDAGNLSDGERTAFADYMIGVWTRFRDENRVVAAQHSKRRSPINRPKHPSTS